MARFPEIRRVEGGYVRRSAPRVPTVENMGGRSAPSPARGPRFEGSSRADTTFGEIAETLDVGARGLRRIAIEKEREAEASDRSSLARARALFTTSLIQAEQDLVADPDYAKHEDRFDTNATKIRNRITKSLPSHLHGFFDTATMAEEARAKSRVASKARQLWKSAKLGELDEQKDSSLAAATAPDADDDTRMVLLDAYREAVNSAQVMGIIDGAEAIKRKRDFAVSYSKARVGDWFRKQPDALTAAQQIHEGRITDAGVQASWDRLGEEDRRKVFSDLVSTANTIASMENQRRNELRQAQQDAADDRVRGFFFDEKMSFETRQEEYRRLSKSPYVSVTTLKAMEQMLAEGVEGRVDNQDHLFHLEGRIQDGEIRTRQELFDEIGRLNLTVTSRTLRTRLAPMIDARDDEAFRNALDWGTSELKIFARRGGGALFSTPDDIERATWFDANLRKWRQENPKGDYWKKAEELVALGKKQVGRSGMAKLPIVERAYRQALREGNMVAIEQRKIAFIATMIEAGIDIGVEAGDPKFDPAAYMDDLRAAKKAQSQ